MVHMMLCRSLLVVIELLIIMVINLIFTTKAIAFMLCDLRRNQKGLELDE